MHLFPGAIQIMGVKIVNPFSVRTSDIGSIIHEDSQVLAQPAIITTIHTLERNVLNDFAYEILVSFLSRLISKLISAKYTN